MGQPASVTPGRAMDLQQIAAELEITVEAAATLAAELLPPADLQQLAEILVMDAADLVALRLGAPEFYSDLRELAQLPRDPAPD